MAGTCVIRYVYKYIIKRFIIETSLTKYIIHLSKMKNVNRDINARQVILTRMNR